jgi:hypothetical protein
MIFGVLSITLHVKCLYNIQNQRVNVFMYISCLFSINDHLSYNMHTCSRQYGFFYSGVHVSFSSSCYGCYYQQPF